MHEITGSSIRNIGSSRQAERFPVFLAIGRSATLAATVVALGLFSGTIAAQQQEQSKQDIPDAPSASRPFPNVPPTGHAPQDHPPPNQAPPPPNQAPPTSPTPTEDPVYAPGVAPAPPFNVSTVPAGSVPAERSDELYKIVTNVNQVLVPVMVKDDSGRLVNG